MIPKDSSPGRRLLCLQRYSGVPTETGQGGCLQNLRWLAYVPSESQAGRQRITPPAVSPKAMALRRGKRRKLYLVWLESVHTDLPATAMRSCSMARRFHTRQRHSFVIIIADLEVAVVAADKIGWTTGSTTDPYISHGIKVLISCQA
jgi:hypothetical protein